MTTGGGHTDCDDAPDESAGATIDAAPRKVDGAFLPIPWDFVSEDSQ